MSVAYYLCSQNIHTGKKEYFVNVDGEPVAYSVYEALAELATLNRAANVNTQYGACTEAYYKNKVKRGGAA